MLNFHLWLENNDAIKFFLHLLTALAMLSVNGALITFSDYDKITAGTARMKELNLAMQHSFNYATLIYQRDGRKDLTNNFFPFVVGFR
jgi:hypothetical protein